jgi:hypothetical protein
MYRFADFFCRLKSLGCKDETKKTLDDAVWLKGEQKAAAPSLSLFRGLAPHFVWSNVEHVW